MNLPDWIERAAPPQLSHYLDRVASPRKAGLFVRHLCRGFPQIFTDPRSRAALDAADRFEAGDIGDDEFQAAVGAAGDAQAETQAAYNIRAYEPDAYLATATRAAAMAAGLARTVAEHGHYPQVLSHLRRAVLDHAGRGAGPRKNPVARVVRPLFFEHFGDTEHPVALDPAWRTEAVVGLAIRIYADRAFDRLPVLADALEDAGCANADVLGHCRGPGPHARGCWVVDLLLGKT